MSTSDFATLGVSVPVLQAITELGYEQASPIQAQSIPLLLQGKNLLGTAQTGTGKTAAFALPLLSRIKPNGQKPQVLVLTPTRELAIQVAEAFKSYARYINHFHVVPIYGGQDIRGQLRSLQRGVDVVVGTPGRIMDHLSRRTLDLSELSAVVLDEADEMLRMGFIDDVEEILSKAPADSQRALFSATMPPAIRRVAAKYLGAAEEIRIATKTSTVESIEQHYLLVHNHHKLDALTRILEVEEFDGMIIFVRTKSSTVDLAEKLEARGFTATAINGDLSQSLRESTINRLKKGQLDILVATDVAARGLDVDRISHIVNYDIPNDTESYVHRIGRTGRAGRSGKAILFATPKERRLLYAIEKATRQPLTAMTVPSGEQVSGQRVQRFQLALQKTLQEQDLGKIRALLEKISHDQELDIGQIAAALAWEIQQDRPLFPKLEPLASATSAERKERTDSRDRPARSAGANHKERPTSSTGADRKGQPDRPHKTGKDVTGRDAKDASTVCYRIEVGKEQGATPGDIVGAIANEAGIESRYIGRIAIHENYSTVELPEGMPREIFKRLKNVRVRQTPMAISEVSGLQPGTPSPVQGSTAESSIRTSPKIAMKPKPSPGKPARRKSPPGKTLSSKAGAGKSVSSKTKPGTLTLGKFSPGKSSAHKPTNRKPGAGKSAASKPPAHKKGPRQVP